MNKTYYIYHIPNVKIGCSIKPEKRVKLQGYKKYEILEKHKDIYIASKREKKLQEEYGYKVDNSPYYQTIEFSKKSYTKTKRPKKKEVKTETIEERTIRLKKWHEDMKKRKVGFYDKQVSYNAGMVSKEKFSKPIKAYKYPSMEYIGEFTSKKDFGRQYEISNVGNIRNVLKGRAKSCYGFTFEYA